MSPVPFFEVHFRQDNARSMLVKSRTHRHDPSEKQWLPSIRGKQEPPRRARLGAPTCSHESLVGCFPTTTNHRQGDTFSDPTRVLTEGEGQTSFDVNIFLSGSESQDADEEEEEEEEEEEGQTPTLKSGPKDDDSFSEVLLFLQPCCKNVSTIFES